MLVMLWLREILASHPSAKARMDGAPCGSGLWSCSGRCGLRVVGVGGGDEGGRLGVAAVAGAAGDFVGGGRVFELGEKALIDLVGHADHGAGAVFDGVVVGGEVEVADAGFVGGVLGVAVVAVDAQLVFKLVHDGDNLIAGEVLGQHLKVSGLGTRTVGARQLRRGRVGRCGGGRLRVERGREGEGEKGGKCC